MPRYLPSVASALLGAALVAVAFGARAGSELTRTTAVEIALVLACGLVLAIAAARGRLGETPGIVCAALLALLAVVTAASIAWSISPGLSWIEANLTLAYAAVFAAGVAAARLAPDGAAVLLRALLPAAAVAVGYSLLSRVFPAALAADEVYARISQPFDYWNAVGVTAALAIPPALWLGARRSGHAPVNALAYPLMGLFLVALFLSYSRGALAAAAIGTALWFAWVPLRLRSLAVLALPALAATPVVAWAVSQDAFSRDGMPLNARQAVGGEFGLLLAAMLVGLLGTGLAVGFRLSLRAPGFVLRRRLGVAALASVGAVALFGFASVALSEPGLAGTVSGGIRDATSREARTGGGPERLTQTSSARSEYWRQAISVYSEQPWLGTGAGTFAVARLRYRPNPFAARHAHGYVVQTMSDLGLLGVGVSLALVGAWLFAAGRAVGLRRGPPVLAAFRRWKAETLGNPAPPRLDPPRRDLAFGANRVALAALALSALVFGLQSAIDWTWFVPGPTVMAIAAAGFVAGRGAPAQALAGDDREETPTTPTRPLTLVREAADGDGAPAPDASDRAVALESTVVLQPDATRSGRRRRLALAGAVLVTTGLCAWAIWQPARSDSHAARALELIEADRLPEAAREAHAATEIDPLSARPLLVTASVQGAAGDERAALKTLERAVHEHPSDPQVWLRLASFELRTLERPNATLETLRGVLYIDPQSRAVQPLYYEARALQREQDAAAKGRR